MPKIQIRITAERISFYFPILGIGLGILWVPSKNSTTKLHLQPLNNTHHSSFPKQEESFHSHRFRTAFSRRLRGGENMCAPHRAHWGQRKLAWVSSLPHIVSGRLYPLSYLASPNLSILKIVLPLYYWVLWLIFFSIRVFIMGYNIVWLLSWIFMCFVFGNFKNGAEGPRMSNYNSGCRSQLFQPCCVFVIFIVAMIEDLSSSNWGRWGYRGYSSRRFPSLRLGKGGWQEWGSGQITKQRMSRLSRRTIKLQGLSPMTPFFQEVSNF